VKLLPKIVNANTNFEETRNLFTMNDLIRSKDFKILSYEGSLTTPNCFETVTWLVSTTPLKISSAEIAEFRKIKDEKGNLLLKNNRPVQLLNNRQISLF
jgi:carbonic anhydrase